MVTRVLDNVAASLTALSRPTARLGVGAALALPALAGSFAPAAAVPLPGADVEAMCVAQMTVLPELAGLDIATAQDTITCTDGNGVPLVSGSSELTITSDGTPCSDSATTITTRWDDGTHTVTQTTGTIDAADFTYTATGRVTADSTRFAGAAVTVVGTDPEPGCGGDQQPGVVLYSVTFRR